MLVIVVNNVPPALRGRLSLWLLEVRAGVYVGRLTKRSRESLWRTVVENLGAGDAVMVTPRPKAEDGFAVRTAGENRRCPEDWDGLTLIAFAPSPTEDSSETGGGLGTPQISV